MVQGDIFHGGPAPVEQGQIIAVLCVVLPRVDWVRELIYCRTKATFLMVHLPVDRPRATFLMVKGDVSHGSAGRKATFFIVQRRQLSWIPEPVMATYFMAPRRPTSSMFLEERVHRDVFHRPRAAGFQ
jgi:hypothetical protein